MYSLKVGMDFTQMVTNRILENLEGEEKEEQLDQMRRQGNIEDIYHLASELLCDF